jgi:hypothetical protein
MLLGGACGGAPMSTANGPQATLALISPVAPLGLHYGEQATLVLRYLLSGQPTPGVTLSLHIDSDNTGATLSSDEIVTNDDGEASVLLTAGAAEAAFHVVGTAPMAANLSIDVAVSKYAFGNLNVLVDATMVPGMVEQVQAALFPGTSCAALSPTPVLMLGTEGRGQQAAGQQAMLAFPTLLVRSYSVIGRAEDASSRLLAYGCVDIPDTILTDPGAVVSVPLSPVYPSPLGNYAMTLHLTSAPQQPPTLWNELACSQGLGQVLLDATLQALTATNEKLAMQLQGMRTNPDGNGCRSGTGTPDDNLQGLLAPASPPAPPGGAGATLVQVAPDGAAVQDGLQLTTELQVYASGSSDILAAHTLQAATFSSSKGSNTYVLTTLPVPTASDLLLGQKGDVLTVPEHELTLRLPALWRQAFDDLVLPPPMTPEELFQTAVASATSGVNMGCAAVEAMLCMGVTPPCVGELQPACLTAATAVGANLTSVLADAAPGFDLSLSMTLTMEDPTGTLQAQTLDQGQVNGQAITAAAVLTLTGTATGTRTGP